MTVLSCSRCSSVYSGAQAPARRWSTRTRSCSHTYTHACTGRFKMINTHRQDGRIVQSHHHIPCNNSKCRRCALLCLSSSHAASLSLPLSEPVSPHQLGLSCLSHRFKISLSLPPLALCAMPIPPSRPLLCFFTTFFSSAGCLRYSSLVCVLSFLWSPTRFFSLPLPLTPFFMATPSLLFCCYTLACSSPLPPLSPR